MLLIREHIPRGGALAWFLEETEAGFARGPAARAWFQTREPRSDFGSPPAYLRPLVVTFGLREEHKFGPLANFRACRVLFAIETAEGILGGRAHLDRRRYRGQSAHFPWEFDLHQPYVVCRDKFEVDRRTGDAVRAALDSDAALEVIQIVFTCPDPEALTFLGGDPLIFADWLEGRGWPDAAGRIREASGR